MNSKLITVISLLFYRFFPWNWGNIEIHVFQVTLHRSDVKKIRKLREITLWMKRYFVKSIYNKHSSGGMEITENSRSQKFREINVFTKEPYSKLIWRKRFAYLQAWQCGKMNHWTRISSNQLFSNFFSKNVIFTKFLPKMCDSKFL